MGNLAILKSMEKKMSENQQKDYEQSPVWRKLNELEVRITTIGAEVRAMPLAVRIELEKTFPTYKDVEIRLNTQNEYNEHKFLQKKEAKQEWIDCYEIYSGKKFEKTSRWITISKGIGWVLTSIATGAITVLVWADNILP